MLKTLRWRLTLLFTLIILLFVAVVGVGGYLLLNRNYARTIDLSLQYRMSLQFQHYGYSLPLELQSAVAVWQEEQGPILGTYTLNLDGGEHEREEAEKNDDDGEISHDAHELVEGAYSSDLALIFVFPLDQQRNLITDPNPFVAPLPPDIEAASDAQENGLDWRTKTLDSGERVRLLSYAVPNSSDLAIIQLGRSMADQDQALRQLLLGVSVLGGFLLVFAAAGSWWMAGRSLGPAQRAWDQQQAFIANASHELRTPLTLIRASVEVAQRGKLDKKEKELLADVIAETDYMGLLVDDLLLLSRLDSGRLHLEKESISVSELIGEIQRQVGKMAGAHKFIPAQSIPAVSLQADPTRLRQILLILLDNALSHTPPGTRIWLEVEAQDGALILRVRDDGPGIPAEHLPHIFERFYQVDSSHGGQARSNGLGLSIAKGLAELHQGSICVRNDGGAVFEVRLPR